MKFFLFLCFVALGLSCKPNRSSLKSEGGSSLNYPLSEACKKEYPAWCRAISNITGNESVNCKEVPEKSLFLISSLAPNQGSPVDKLSPFDSKWKSKVGGETLCLPMNPLLSALGNNSNNQDEILELILQKLSELPPTMRKILQIAEKSRLITAGKPLV